MIVQIYGITTPEDAAAVCACRPDHVGVVLDEGLETWDEVDLDVAREILAAVHPSITTVALSLRSDVDGIRRTVEALEPSAVHLARAVDAMTPDDVDRLRQCIEPVQIMTTVPVRDGTAIDVAKAFAPVSDWLLLDTAHPVTGVVGATGHVHDWSTSAAIVKAVDVPVILAGGLGPENVDAAIAAVAPAGVDSETRTSREDDKRRKDAAKVKAFIDRARAAAVQ